MANNCARRAGYFSAPGTCASALFFFFSLARTRFARRGTGWMDGWMDGGKSKLGREKSFIAERGAGKKRRRDGCAREDKTK